MTSIREFVVTYTEIKTEYSVISGFRAGQNCHCNAVVHEVGNLLAYNLLSALSIIEESYD